MCNTDYILNTNLSVVFIVQLQEAFWCQGRTHRRAHKVFTTTSGVRSQSQSLRLNSRMRSITLARICLWYCKLTDICFVLVVDKNVFHAWSSDMNEHQMQYFPVVGSTSVGATLWHIYCHEMKWILIFKQMKYFYFAISYFNIIWQLQIKIVIY